MAGKGAFSFITSTEKEEQAAATATSYESPAASAVSLNSTAIMIAAKPNHLARTPSHAKYWQSLKELTRGQQLGKLI